MKKITDFHAHIYFSEQSFSQAQVLCDTANKKFELILGRMHQKPVGPHPCWSCQLAFSNQVFGELIPWLALNRQGLTIFIHPNTDDALKDHSQHSIWMGEIETLNLSVFDKN